MQRVYPAIAPGHKPGTQLTRPRSDRTLRQTLDLFLEGVDRASLLSRDPVELVHAYEDPADQEVAGFLVAMLAYGRAASIRGAAGRALAHLGPHPAGAVDRGRTGKLAGFVYRFQRGDDLVRLLSALARVRRRHGSLGACFAGLAGDEPTYAETMGRFVDEVTAAVDGELSYGLRFLLPNPRGGGAAKRLCLFLRWMIRPADGLDLGAWPDLDPARLIIPLDTHITTLGRYLGLTDRTTPNLQMAMEITASLRRLRPEDPLAYDMALCHLCIAGRCKKRWDPEICPTCPIQGGCRLIGS